MAMLSFTLPKTVIAAAVLLCAGSASVVASRADEVVANLHENAAVFVDARTFEVTPATARAGIRDDVKSLNVRYLGPAAIVFRIGDKLYVASIPLPLQGAAPGDTYVTAEDVPSGRIQVQYEPPKNPAHQKLYEMVMRRHTLEIVQTMFSPIKLPIDLLIKTVGCDGVSNAWYQLEGGKPTIKLCYEYLEDIWNSMPEQDASSGKLTMADAICGQLFFAAAHEIGHAMFDIFDVPVFGRQEDAADQFATYVMLQFGGSQAYRFVSGAAYGYHGYIKDLKQKPTVTLPVAAFSSDHGAPEERYFNLICIAYGYDPKLFAVEMEKLPESRAKKCKYEYEDIKFAMLTVFHSHVDQEALNQVLAINWLDRVPH